MSDFASAWSCDASSFAGAEWREVIMQIELLRIFRHQSVNDLLILGRAECASHDGLRFATLEECRTVGSRQERHAHIERTNLSKRTTIGADAFFCNQIMRDLLFKNAQAFLCFTHFALSNLVVAVTQTRSQLEERVDCPFLDTINFCVSSVFPVDLSSCEQWLICLLFHDRHHFC